MVENHSLVPILLKKSTTIGNLEPVDIDTDNNREDRVAAPVPASEAEDERENLLMQLGFYQDHLSEVEKVKFDNRVC